MSTPFIVLGAGGHARVVVDLLRASNFEVKGCIGPQAPEQSIGAPWLGADSSITVGDANSIRLANGIGSVGDATARIKAFTQFKTAGFDFPALVHPQASVSANAELSEGVQIMMGACVQVGARLGENVLVNTGATVDHDCIIGDHVGISPGATLCGNVTVEDEAHIGPGAVILQGVRIGRRAIVAAGAVVRNDVPAGTRVQGVPAQEHSR